MNPQVCAGDDASQPPIYVLCHDPATGAIQTAHVDGFPNPWGCCLRLAHEHPSHLPSRRPPIPFTAYRLPFTCLPFTLFGVHLKKRPCASASMRSELPSRAPRS